MSWFANLENALPTIEREQISQFAVPDTYERSAAVLVLFGPNKNGHEDGDLLIIERASHLYDHPGQPAFPGGHVEDQDESLIHTALREAHEEIGLIADSVRVVGLLPQLWLPPSKVAVTPVVAWWEEPHEITKVDKNEVAGVHLVPVKDLVNPENRIMVPGRSNFIGPAFEVNDMVVWGFTGGLISALLDIGGVAQEWDRSKRNDLNRDLSY